MTTVALSPLPFEEASAFWKDKVRLGPAEFNRLSDEVKLKAFAVSGIAKGNELETVFNSISRAIDKGISFDKFKTECGDIFERRGWTGKRAWRVDNIFRTNIQTAYNAGRYQQLKGMTRTFPYWQYDAVNDRRTRPLHRALDGKIFPADHPFWATWYPPNGFRCRCSVISMTRDEAQGQTIETADPTNTLIEPLDPVTGNRLPARELLPDPGFAYHPGKGAWGGMVESSGKPDKWLSLPGLHGPADYRRRALGNVRPADIAELPHDFLPSGKADAFYKDKFLKHYGEEKVIRDAAGEAVILSMRSFLADKTPGAPAVWKFSKPGHGEMIPNLSRMIEEPYEVWLTPQKNEAGKIRLSRRYISLWKTEKDRIGGLLVFEVADNVWQGVTAFIPFKGSIPDLAYVERQRQGLLLYGR